MEQTKSKTAVSDPAVKKKKNRKKKRVNKFKWGMICYVTVFFSALAIVLKICWDFLGEYEASRPIHAMEDYLPTIDADLLKQLANEELNHFEMTEYETPELLGEYVQKALPEYPSYHFTKKFDYTDEVPSYQILSEDLTIASVKLRQTDKTKKFGFPIWQVGEPSACLEISMTARYCVDIMADSDMIVQVNGKTLNEADITEQFPSVELSQNVTDLIGQPAKLHYVIKGLYQPPVVTAKLSNGEPLSSKLPAPNETIAKQEYDFTGQQSAILAAEHSEYMKKLCTAYINYVFNKDRSPERNFNYLSAYLLKNGEAYKQLYDFMGELRWNQQYTARKDNLLTAENFCHYSDSCFSCDTHFQMSLTKNEVSNDYEATVRWYMVETSDGWRAAKMEII